MKKDLTNSEIDRQNILNNPYALSEIEKAAGIQGIPFEGKTVVLKEQVAAFFEVTVRTVENYLEAHPEELGRNGYEVVVGKRLKALKLSIDGMDDPEMDFGIIKKTARLGVFDFRAFLNLAMLMRESERAGLLRRAILDIVIDAINARTGGGTKYINQRDEDFIQSAFIEENYRKKFTNALRDCVAMGNFKYAVYTDKIYVSIFKEKAREYRKVLRLEKKQNLRDTFYSEILDLISAYECGFADALHLQLNYYITLRPVRSRGNFSASGCLPFSRLRRTMSPCNRRFSATTRISPHDHRHHHSQSLKLLRHTLRRSRGFTGRKLHSNELTTNEPFPGNSICF